MDPCVICGKDLEKHRRCPVCGYSLCDAKLWMDHGRCKGTIPGSATQQITDKSKGVSYPEGAK